MEGCRAAWLLAGGVALFSSPLLAQGQGNFEIEGAPAEDLRFEVEKGVNVERDQSSTSPSLVPHRLVDLGVRPLFSFPDAVGVNFEVHPLGGYLALEGGAAVQAGLTAGFNMGLKYRLPFLHRRSAAYSVGPGVSSHWLFDGPRGGYMAQIVSALAAFEAVWWRENAGFRLALDLGVAGALVDKHYYGRSFDGLAPVLNSSVGVAFRLLP